MNPISLDPIRTIPCEVCPRMFVTQVDADQHMLTVNHYRNRCNLCQQKFPSEDALETHRWTHFHWTYNMYCPFCGSHFDKASSLMVHLEEGKCKNAPGLEHHSILWLVRNCDPDGVITDTTFRWLLTKWIPTPPSENPEPHMCFTCHLIFHTKEELEVHLNCPTHDPGAHRPRVYRCPNLHGMCQKKSFGSLTALYKHLESGSCGTMNFHSVQRMQLTLMRAFWGCGINQPRGRDVVNMPNASIIDH